MPSASTVSTSSSTPYAGSTSRHSPVDRSPTAYTKLTICDASGSPTAKSRPDSSWRKYRRSSVDMRSRYRRRPVRCARGRATRAPHGRPADRVRWRSCDGRCQKRSPRRSFPAIGCSSSRRRATCCTSRRRPRRLLPMPSRRPPRRSARSAGCTDEQITELFERFADRLADDTTAAADPRRQRARRRVGDRPPGARRRVSS